jgi:hypothetical protein
MPPPPRLYVDSAPHVVGNVALTLNNWRGFCSSLRWRGIDFTSAIDNLTGK